MGHKARNIKPASPDSLEKLPEATGSCYSKKVVKDIEAPSVGVIEIDTFIALVSRLLEDCAAEAAEQMDEPEEEEPNVSIIGALIRIVVGTALVTVFSDAMVDAIDSFGRTTGVPNFISGFVLCPYVSNASELISSLQFAARKKKKNMSVCVSQIYAACTMN